MYGAVRVRSLARGDAGQKPTARLRTTTGHRSHTARMHLVTLRATDGRATDGRPCKVLPSHRVRSRPNGKWSASDTGGERDLPKTKKFAKKC